MNKSTSSMLLCFALLGSCVIGVLTEYTWPSSDLGVFQGRLGIRCAKCASADIKYRHCAERCMTVCMSPNPGFGKQGSKVVWGYEHLHRSCRRCGYDGDAVECADVGRLTNP